MRIGSVITVREGERELLRGLKRQVSVILAIIFKEVKVRSRTSKFGIIFVLIEPMMYILVIAAIRWLLRGRESVDGLHVLIWIPLGVAPFLMFRRSVASVPSAVGSNRGLLEYPQVKPIDPVIAVFILEMCLTMVGSAAAIFLIWWVVGVVPTFPQPLEAIGVLMVFWIGCFGFALLLAVYGTFYETIPRIMRFLSRPLLFISGVIFPVSALPASFREYLAWNPILQYIEYIRLYAAGHLLIAEADLQYAVLCSALALGVGFTAYYANRYKLVQSR